MKPKKDLRPIFDYARELGFAKPEVTGGDHWRFRHPDTGKSVTVSSTPSDKGRFEVQARSDLRKAAPPAMVAKKNIEQRKAPDSGRRAPGALQQLFLDTLVDAEPEGMTAPELKKRTGYKSEPHAQLNALASQGLVVADKTVTPWVWRPLLSGPIKQPPKTPPTALQNPLSEPLEAAPEVTPVAPAPAPVSVTEPREAPTTLLAEVVATMELKLVRDTDGRYWFVLPISLGG